MNNKITNREDDFAKWYTDIVKEANLIDYSSVKGCMIIKPRGYAIWENIQSVLNDMIKKTGHHNVYLPLFIPESLLEKEKNHVEGFAPEVAWVTHGGDKKLTERLCVRPTSEALFCEYFANEIKSYRDLPVMTNQWCSVVRWEKETRPFLRTREFLWQEGHTIHVTKEEAEEETLKMLDVYKTLLEEYLAIPVLTGRKTEKEKFSGAVDTYTVEAQMYNGVSLQCATSHFFGDNFTKPFEVKYTGKDNKVAYPYQTSWGTTTRLIGGLIMVHSDNRGLVLPPKIAPIQAVVLPLGKKNEDVLKHVTDIASKLESQGVRVNVDNSDKSPGFKFAEHEMNGVPVRIEVGPRDLENGTCMIARRDTSEKIKVELSKCVETVTKLLEDIQTNLYNSAKARNDEKTFKATTLDDFKKIADTQMGYIEAPWCGSDECEETLKNMTGIKSRCIPFNGKVNDKDVCAICGKKATEHVVWGQQY